MNNSNQQLSIRQMKLAMSGVIVVLSALVYALFSERAPNETDPNAIGLVFFAAGIATSIIGLFMASQARNSQPEKAVIAAANFEVAALLAFIYVAFINTEAPLWISPVVGLYAIAMIWANVPNGDDAQPSS